MPAKTVTSIYRHYTGDTDTHQRTITTAYAKTDKRTQAWVCDMILGRSIHEIAKAAALSRGTVGGAIEKAMNITWKRIHEKPSRFTRYDAKRPKKKSQASR